MNERIRELAEQAETYAQSEYDKWVPTPDFSGVPNIRAIYSQKFAELIVRECMILMNNERDYYSRPGSYEPESYYIRCAAKVDAFDDAASLIKHHFGIEE